jgi:hypothetical protein
MSPPTSALIRRRRLAPGQLCATDGAAGLERGSARWRGRFVLFRASGGSRLRTHARSVGAGRTCRKGLVNVALGSCLRTSGMRTARGRNSRGISIRTRTRLSSWCKPCTKEYDREYAARKKAAQS